MGHGPGVLGELGGAHDAHVVDALHGAGRHVLGEVLVAEDREALLERQLEPVAARHAVARPVVEVLVRDDAQDAVVVGVRGRRGLGQHAGRVEDVEALVLHGAHVEVGDGDDVVHVEVVLAAVRVLVPLHGALEGLEGPVELVGVLVLAPHAQVDLPPRGRRELAPDAAQVAGHQGEEVRGLLEGVLEGSPVAAVLGVALADLVAVAQQNGVLGLVGLHAARVGGHAVGPVVHVRDAPEALGLALRAHVARGLVEARQLRVLLGLDGHDGLELELAGRGRGDGQRLLAQLVLGLGQRLAVDLDRHEAQVLAVQDQRAAGRRLDLELGRHEGLISLNVEVQRDVGDGVGQRRVIFPEALHWRRGGDDAALRAAGAGTADAGRAAA
mmetsp:Transcript_8532/g.25675  ORF Transcript_8532/g.25675 Transcript_8532/m.25675 type:complete len:384 (+) Transcript_8532:1581-2732(+)